MEQFSIELNEIRHKRTKLIRLWVGGAIVLIVLIILSILLVGNRLTLYEIVVPTLVYISIYIYFTYRTYNAHIYIKADEYAVEYKFGMLSNTVKSVIWDTITRIKFGPTYIAFFKRTGKKTVVQLGWLPYAKVKEIKEKICEVAQTKSIPCEWAEYKRY